VGNSVERDQLKLLAALSKELDEGNLAIFAGAGFSRAAGYVDWKNLLRPIADDLDLDVEKEWDLVTLAQYHANVNHANRAKINQLLVSEFSRNLKPTENHRILARLPIATFWTTNYDNLIETALVDDGKVPDIKYTKEHLATTRPHRDAIVYKMHGDAAHPDKAILIRDDYERYHIKMAPFITALSGDLVSKTFLFLGFSFTDPNLEYILSRVRVYYDNNQRQHHCILRRVVKAADESQADFEYRQRKEELFSGELLRVGIKATYIDDFPQITEILRVLESRHKRKTVFISGAAHDYSPWSQPEAEQFVYQLSRMIAREKFRVISGFGLGIGSAVISGVLEETYMTGGRLDNDELVLRPFPQTQPGERSRKELWTAYRNSMLDYAGVAIFLFGNKLQDEKVVPSDGMREEFEIARNKGVFLIPVGITGSISKVLWQEVMDNFNPEQHQHGAEIHKLLQALGDVNTNLDAAKGLLMKLLKII
jgi:hypothetical protein